MSTHEYEYQQYLLRLQESNVLDGVKNEPRVFYDTITLGEPLIEVNGHPDVFRNGEDFPVRITHALMAMARLDAAGDAVNPRQIQRVGLRLKFHDQYYMNMYSANPIFGSQRQTFVPATSWALDPTAASDIVSFGASAWQFQRPFVLSVRDTMRIDVQLDEAPVSAVPVTVSLTGIGMLSRRPYFFTGGVLVADALRHAISTENYINDGTEPVLITNTTVNCGADVVDADPTGDSSRVSVGFRQIGNGTNAAWVQGPINDPPIVPDLVPAVVLGQQSGRAVVHRFPGHGLLWAQAKASLRRCRTLI